MGISLSDNFLHRNPMEPAMRTPPDLISPDLAEAIANHTRGVVPVCDRRAFDLMVQTAEDLRHVLARRSGEVAALLRALAAMALPEGQAIGQITVAGETYLVWRGEDGTFGGTRVFPQLDF
jgi:hypothetical protein